MIWTPAPTLTIGGVDYTGATLETVRIVRGRPEVFSEPRAGYLIAELIDLVGDGIPVRPFDRVEFTLDDSNGDPVTVFVGQVSDTSAVLFDTGVESGTPGSVTTVIAVAALARLSRRVVLEDGGPAEQDGDRIARLVEAGLAATWEETPGTWAQQGDLTWETFDQGLDLNRIDQPGVFDISALPAEDTGYNPLAQGYLTAFSAQGILWDDREGFIAYADADRRIATDVADDYLTVPASILSAQQLSVQSNAGDITTSVSVAFEGGAVIFDDTAAFLRVGRLARQFETNLVNQSNAEAWAERYLLGHSGDIIKLQKVTARLDILTDDSLRDSLLELDVNAGIELDGIPGTLGLTFRRTFVEGIGWNVDRDRIAIALDLSDAELSVGFQRWSSVDPNLAWQDVSATLTWQDARTVTA
jgi:hypothetical protein